MDRTNINYQCLFDQAADGVFIVNPETALIENVNSHLLTLLGYSADAFIGKKLWETVAFKNSVVNEAGFNGLIQDKYRRIDDLAIETVDGRTLSVELIAKVCDCEGVSVVLFNIRDNSKRNLEQLPLKVAQRQLKMLMESNAALLSQATEESLLKDFCRVAVEVGGYRMAWVGVAEDKEGKPVTPIAHYGIDEGYLDHVNVTWADTERGRGPTGAAIRTGQVQFFEDFEKESRFKPWLHEALKRGFHASIAIPLEMSGDVKACLTIYCATPSIWSPPEREILIQVANDLELGLKHFRVSVSKALYEAKFQKSLEDTVLALAETIGKRDPYTARHQRRAARIAEKIGIEMGLSSDRIHGLFLAASIHDLGKVGVPEEILSKSAELNSPEYALLQEHVKIGFEIIKNVDYPWPIAEMIFQHHEHIDGTGYPRGLKGDQILLEAKIISVANVVEAMSSPRPYRIGLGIDAALDEIITHRGTFFDPDVVDICVKLFREKGYKIEE